MCRTSSRAGWNTVPEPRVQSVTTRFSDAGAYQIYRTKAQKREKAQDVIGQKQKGKRHVPAGCSAAAWSSSHAAAALRWICTATLSHNRMEENTKNISVRSFLSCNQAKNKAKRNFWIRKNPSKPCGSKGFVWWTIQDSNSQIVVFYYFFRQNM